MFSLCPYMKNYRMLKVLQDMSIEGGPRALALLRDADIGCLCFTSFCLNLNLFLHFAIGVWTASMTHKPYALDPDFDLQY